MGASNQPHTRDERQQDRNHQPSQRRCYKHHGSQRCRWPRRCRWWREDLDGIGDVGLRLNPLKLLLCKNLRECVTIRYDSNRL